MPVSPRACPYFAVRDFDLRVCLIIQWRPIIAVTDSNSRSSADWPRQCKPCIAILLGELRLAFRPHTRTAGYQAHAARPPSEQTSWALTCLNGSRSFLTLFGPSSQSAAVEACVIWSVRCTRVHHGTSDTMQQPTFLIMIHSGLREDSNQDRVPEWHLRKPRSLCT